MSRLSETIPADYSWTRPNRRHVWNGLYLPGIVCEAVSGICIAVRLLWVHCEVGFERVSQFNREYGRFLTNPAARCQGASRAALWRAKGDEALTGRCGLAPGDVRKAGCTDSAKEGHCLPFIPKGAPPHGPGLTKLT